MPSRSLISNIAQTHKLYNDREKSNTKAALLANVILLPVHNL